MRKSRRLLTFIAASALSLASALGTGVAAADQQPGSVQWSTGGYDVHENQGYATLTITRTHADTGDEWVRYGVRQASAMNGKDFDVIPNSIAHFAPGQTSYSFRVHIYDRGMNAPAVHAVAYMFGSYPQSLGKPHQVWLRILRDDKADQRDNSNPLGLDPAPTDGNPIEGANWFVAGDTSPAGIARKSFVHGNPLFANALSVIADAPGARRFWFWNEPNPSKLVAGYLAWTQQVQPGTTVQLSTYSLVHGGCGYTETPGFTRRYHRWIDRLARGIGNFRVAMFFEIDSLITTGCLSPRQRYIRLHDQLKWAVDRLEKQPHLVLYLDAGAADAQPWHTMAKELDKAGVHDAQGFFLNATHFDWTTRELYYGQRIARALGGVHFVINTGENGRGPLVPSDRSRYGNEVLCNPPGRGLGPLTTTTGYKWADGFLWFSNPGGSGGACRPGAPPTAHYWAAYAVMLVRNAVYRVTGPSYPLIHEGSPTAAAATYTPVSAAKWLRRGHRSKAAVRRSNIRMHVRVKVKG
jgi:endoglucanase